MSFGPPIETLDDYNARLDACGCCLIPTFDPPQIYRQQKGAVDSVICGVLMFQTIPVGDFDPQPACADLRAVYRTRNQTITLTNFGNTGATEVDYTNRSYARDVNGECDETVDVDINHGRSTTVDGTYADLAFTRFESVDVGTTPPYTYTIDQVVVLGDRLSEGDCQREMIENLDAVAAATSWSSATTGNSCADGIVLESTLAGTLPVYYNDCPDTTSDLDTAPYFGRDGLGRQPVYQGVSYTFYRYKWQVPTTFEGSYCKVTYDVVYVPLGYDPEDPGTPQPVALLTDQTYEWTGPGDPEDADSWRFPADWISWPRPDDFGKVEIANFRYQWLQNYPPNVCGPSHEFPPP